MVVAIPFEFSHAIGPFPPLSPIDYICVLALATSLFQLGPKSFLQRTVSTFSAPGVLGWMAFIVYGLFMSRYIPGGQWRGPLRWGEFLFFYFLAVWAARHSEGFKVRFGAMCLALGGVIGAIGLWQFYHTGWDYHHSFGRFMQHNIQGAFLSLVLPMCVAVAFRFRGRFYGMAWAMTALAAAGFLVACSFGSWVGITMGVMIVALCRATLLQVNLTAQTSRIFLMILFLGAAGIPLIAIHAVPAMGLLPEWSPPNPSEKLDPLPIEVPHKKLLSHLSQRPAYWRAAYLVLRAHPWIGIGPGHFPAGLRSYLDERPGLLYDWEQRQKGHADFWQHLHSIYLQILVEYGSLGLILWGIAMSGLCMPLLPALKSTESLLWAASLSVFAFLIHNSADILFVHSLDLLFACHLALCACCVSRLKVQG